MVTKVFYWSCLTWYITHISAYVQYAHVLSLVITKLANCKLVIPRGLHTAKVYDFPLISEHSKIVIYLNYYRVFNMEGDTNNLLSLFWGIFLFYRIGISQLLFKVLNTYG